MSLVEENEPAANAVNNPLPAGDYVMTLVEFRYRDEDSPANYPPQTCFDVSIAPAS